MLRFCANLSFLFLDSPFPERFARAAQAGFAGVEFMSPYDYAPGEVAAWAREAGVEIVLFNLPAGDWPAGDRGLACLPGRRAQFRDSVEQARAYAQALGCRRLHCLAGIADAGEHPDALRACYIDNIRHAADRLADLGATLLIEPINSRIDMPGYWLDQPAIALALLDEIDRPNVRLQLDVYHAAVMTGDPLPWLERHLPAIAHVQVADHPGRHEPGSGGIDFAAVFACLRRQAYAGWIGCEYRPCGDSEASLTWLRPYRA